MHSLDKPIDQTVIDPSTIFPFHCRREQLAFIHQGQITPSLLLAKFRVWQHNRKREAQTFQARGWKVQCCQDQFPIIISNIAEDS